MSRHAPRAFALLVAALALPAAHAACTFSNGEITNPFAGGCGDVQLTYVSGNIGDATHIALGYAVPVPVASLTPVAGFRQHASLHARHEDLVLTTAVVRSHAVGTTVAGRTIHAYALGDADATVRGSSRSEPAIMINGGIHAREWQTPEAVTEFMERLAQNASDGGLYQYLAENLNVVVLPVMNVDGFLQAQAHPDRTTAHADQPRDGRMRRKNLRVPGSATPVDGDLTTVADNFFGIDLNRNSDVGFGMNGGSSASTTSLIHRGITPASEPEVTALRAAAALGPAARLRMFSDTHSFTQAYLVSTTTNERLTSNTNALINSMRGVGTAAPYGVLFDNPASDIGTTSDWFNTTYQIPAWTLEVEPTSASDYGSSHGHAGFITPDARIASLRDDVARMYVRGAYMMAGPPSVMRVVIAVAGGAVVYDSAWIDGGAMRTLATPTSLELQSGVAYRVWIAFDKPMRTAAGHGGPTLELRAADGPAFDMLAPSGGSWLASVTGDPTGSLRYSFDAWTATVTMPASIGSRSRFRMAIDVRDLAGWSLDADPSTPVDWTGGHWTRYDSASSTDTDVGGDDRSYLLAGPGNGGGGGGGGATDALLLALLLLAARSRRTLSA